MTIHEWTSQRILSLCSEKNITLTTLASHCNISLRDLQSIINGNTMLKVDFVIAVCHALDVSLPAFFNGAEQDPEIYANVNKLLKKQK